MIIANPAQTESEIFYPSEDGEPLAETSFHANAIINTVVILRQYLQDRIALVLADQFVYYKENFPQFRFAPDVAVVLGVAAGERDNYKIWEEGHVPTVIFEMTSKSTQKEDKKQKKAIYESIGVQEYWLFDPKGEWIQEKLRGYVLQDGVYVQKRDGRSQALGLNFQVEGYLLGFYRLDNGERLLALPEMAQALEQEVLARQTAEARAEIAEALIDQEQQAANQARYQAEQESQRAEQESQRAEQEHQRAEQEHQRAELLAARLRELGIDP
jgi:Uma2 family endonuclease